MYQVDPENLAPFLWPWPNFNVYSKARTPHPSTNPYPWDCALSLPVNVGSHKGYQTQCSFSMHISIIKFNIELEYINAITGLISIEASPFLKKNRGGVNRARERKGGRGRDWEKRREGKLQLGYKINKIKLKIIWVY